MQVVLAAAGVVVTLIAATVVNAAVRGACEPFWQAADWRACVATAADATTANTSAASLLTAEQEAALACAGEYAWAMDQSIDYGEAGITNVRSEWGMNAGRVPRAMDFYQMFVTERGANGNDSAVSLTTAAIRDECGFVKVDLDQFRTA